MEFLGTMDINLSIYNDSTIQILGTCVILLVSPIDGCKHDTRFYVAQHSGSVLFSCEDSLYLQLIQPHPALSKYTPCGANINSVPSQTTTCIPAANGQKFSDVCNGLDTFPG